MADETAGAELVASTTELSVAELREWLRQWVANATGQPIEKITVDRPMEEFGLASRDAIALAGDIEDLTGVMLTATIAYQHPTIASMAQRIVDGEPDVPDEDIDDAVYTALRAAADFDAGVHDIAIIGLATRLPGAGHTPESTWEFLIGGGDAITDLPEGRWSEFTADPQIATVLRDGNTYGGYLPEADIKGFDAEFFAMSPLEVERVDPQQRVMMELTWEALEHARIPASELKGTHVGVFVGTSTYDFGLLAALGLNNIDPNAPKSSPAYGITGSSSAIIPNRVSYFYDFRGPSVAIDTACSSTLVAVHQAVRALRDGEAGLALAGGVNMLLAPIVSMGFDSIGAFAANGRIKAFSSDADGVIRGEGAGLVVLKRLVDAERDGDTILGVIKGSAVNSDGRSNGLLAPNPDAQADCLRQAYRDAGISPRDVDYIEAHGTGTLLGDPIEADSLGRVLGHGRSDDQPVLLGSVKTNFGHLESAAGVASLAKVVLGLQHNVLPPSINYAGPHPFIPFDKAHLRVADQPTEWPRYSGVATIGINGFGFGGTNAHVIVQEYVKRPVAADAGPADAASGAELAVTDSAPELLDSAISEAAISEASGLIVLAVSAYMPSRRRRAAADLADWLESPAGQATPLADVGRALSLRSHGRSRAVVLATTHEEAVAGLRAVAAGKTHPTVISADAPAAKGAVWVLSGFGAQHRKMAKQLYLSNPVFAKAVDEVDALVVDEAGYSIKDMFLDDAQDYGIETCQVGIFTVQVALAALLRHHGADAAAVVGHSLGEAAAAYIAGGLCLADAVRVICSRSRLMGEAEASLSGDDIRLMALVEYSVDEITAALADFPDLEIAIYASPQHTVVGGPEPQVNELVARAEAAGKLGRVLPTKGAGHTSQTDVLLGELAAELAGIEPVKLTAGVYSTVHALGYFPPGSDPIHDVDYWVKNMRHSVWFTQAIRMAVDAGYTTFVELNAHPVALVSVAATTFGAGLVDAQLIETLKRKEDEPRGVVAALAKLYAAGQAVDLRSMFGAGDYADIPRTAFLRKEFWPKVQISAVGSTGVPGVHVALPNGSHAWEIAAGAVTDFPALVNAAAGQVLSGATLGQFIAHAGVPADGTLTTTLIPHLGGGAVQVHGKQAGSFRLLFEAVVTGGAVETESVVPQSESLPAVAAAPAQAEVETLPEVVESFGGKWNPDGPVSAEDRLAAIVAESMGYEIEDLPREIPLIELGLDSLMAMRIKNRVEYEFEIPPLQLSAVAGATLIDVGKVLRYAIEHRDEVQALAEQQAAEKAAELAAGETEIDAELAHEDTTVVAEAERIVDAAEPSRPVEVADDTEADVPPRDAAERLTFATWAVVTGVSAKGIFNTLPILTPEVAAKLAARLSERANGEITVDEVLDAENIEQLSSAVREHLEGTGLDGFVRTLRAPVEGSTRTPVFLFHPAGSTSLAYEPLLRRLPSDVPVYGIERVEGSLDERAEEYIPVLRKLQPEGPYVLAGWSLGGIMSLMVAVKMRRQGLEVGLVGMIDTVRSTEPNEEDTLENRKARVLRFQEFARKTYNVEATLDDDQVTELAAASDEEQMSIVLQLVEFAGVKIPGGMIEHQRTSWIDNQAMFRADPADYPYDGHVVLYLGDRYHEGAIELEPRMANRATNGGGWATTIPNLEEVYIGGDHIQMVDEPYISRIGADLTKRLAEISRAAD